MSSALLKFQQTSQDPSEPELVTASVEVSPQPLAIAENGKLIYRNASFAQLLSSPSGKLPVPLPADCSWQATEFKLNGRNFSLLTAPPHSAGLSTQNVGYFAAIGRLVTGVAHDFNNLLTGILLYCDLLQSRLTNDTALWQKAEEIRRAAEQGAALVRQLMTVGREERGERHLVSFNQVVVDLDHLLRHLLGEQIRIEMDLTSDPARVGMTSAQAQQIVLNLAINARDAMPGGGILRIESRMRESQGQKNRVFELIVADTGSGMDPATAARAFDPFFSTKASGRGTGLATVKAIIDAAHGSISVESHTGSGTRIVVHLPEATENTQLDQALEPSGRFTSKQSEDRGATQ